MLNKSRKCTKNNYRIYRPIIRLKKNISNFPYMEGRKEGYSFVTQTLIILIFSPRLIAEF